MNKLEKNEILIAQIIFRELFEIIEIYPNISISIHITNIMRPRSETYNWTNERLLKAIERYKTEIKTMLLNNEKLIT